MRGSKDRTFVRRRPDVGSGAVGTGLRPGLTDGEENIDMDANDRVAVGVLVAGLVEMDCGRGRDSGGVG